MDSIDLTTLVLSAFGRDQQSQQSLKIDEEERHDDDGDDYAGLAFGEAWARLVRNLTGRHESIRAQQRGR